ncbi:MAG TPA: hypothetical protein VNB89_06165, partial [Gemmatimonadaceae bacterium]|nr:hypothetical protein [Gemmatimonadaceae bacterium]
MKRTAPFLVILTAACAAHSSSNAPAPAAARPAWDTAFTVAQRAVGVAASRADIEAIVREGMDRSHVGDDLAYLADVIGPRLTPSAAMKRANDWTATKFRQYGMDSTWLESWKFG